MKVVVATNGRQAAKSAERLVAELADPHKVEIHLFCVSTVEFVMPGEPFVLGTAPVPRAQPEELLEEAAAMFGEQGFVVETASRAGVPAEEVMAYADEQDADLIVAGAGDQTWADRVIWGSTATKLLHASDVSVLIVQSPPGEGLINVLVASDGSEHSAKAAEVFAGFARADRCRVNVISVAQPIPTPVADVLGGLISAPITDDQVNALMDLASATAEVDAVRLREAGFEVGTEIGIGSPARRILEAAEKDSAGLVVAGARGKGRFARLTLGSVSDQLARRAPATLVAHLPRHPGD